MENRIDGLKVNLEMDGMKSFEKKSKKVIKAAKKLQKAIDELNNHHFTVKIKKNRS